MYDDDTLSLRESLSILQLQGIEGLKIYGPPQKNGRAALSAFNVSGVHPSDLATVMDLNGRPALQA